MNPIVNMLNELTSQLDAATVSELVDLYVDNSALQMNVLEESAKLGQVDRLRREAHSLKSASANLGATELAAICLKLEKNAAADEQTRNLVAQAKQLHGHVVTELRAWKKSL